MVSIPDIKIRLQEILPAKRWEHTLGVEYTCCALAMRYGADMNQARIAGLLHDCAKAYSGNQLITFCKEHNLPMNQYEEAFPELLHAKVGAFLARETYGIEDNAVIDAIDCHTTGKQAMSLLEKIVYIADYMEPNRDRAPHLTEIRALAFEDLDACLLRILSGTLTYLKSNGSVIDPQTQATYDYYQKEV